MEIRKTTIFLILIAIIGIAMRLLPHPPNFAPIGALAIFSGAYAISKWRYMALPIVALAISDYFIGFYDIRLMAIVYASSIIVYIIGIKIRKERKIHELLLGSIIGSLFFYLSTNFAVWLFSAWYPKTIIGLLESFTLALPFLRNSMMGDIFYVLLFKLVYELVVNRATLKQKIFYEGNILIKKLSTVIF